MLRCSIEVSLVTEKRKFSLEVTIRHLQTFCDVWNELCLNIVKKLAKI